SAITGDAITSVSAASGTAVDVTVNTGIAGTGDLRLDLIVPGATISDDAGNALTASFTAGQLYTVDHTPPTVVDVLDVSPDPLMPSGSPVDVLLSEPIDVTTFTFTDLSLTRDGSPVTLDATVTTSFVSGTTYRIGGLNTFTAAAGTYLLTVNAGGIKDPA